MIQEEDEDGEIKSRSALVIKSPSYSCIQQKNKTQTHNKELASVLNWFRLTLKAIKCREGSILVVSAVTFQKFQLNKLAIPLLTLNL